ncbi:HAD family hydrolase [Halorussus halophilus]|uniref:HAD family hydrolase n=1 Tax=Halorussus halophilus TaxID=2650975 RepID=UPI001300F086|nr:HAD family hydrolase [Halorussus halophilus]
MQAIHFDLDGTLVALPDDYRALFDRALAAYDIEATDEQHECYTESFFEYFGDCHPEPYRAGMTELRESFDLDPTGAQLAERYCEQEVAATDVRAGVRETLDQLDAPLGVLTNGAERTQSAKLEAGNIAEYFDSVVVSGGVGAAKPDAAIFETARESLSADEHVFVADDLERDVLPAQEVGFTGVYLADGEPENRAERADATITSIRDVPGVLE